ncbi:hypothetical protein BaRGS_00036341 [Batillaria attramentaria]|uniref:rRNA biogenesis protein RRP36 n=1 Tax=Batillaria attramentaria TaxID=370345 RepID=A0ABD0JD94_9CAEN
MMSTKSSGPRLTEALSVLGQRVTGPTVECRPYTSVTRRGLIRDPLSKSCLYGPADDTHRLVSESPLVPSTRAGDDSQKVGDEKESAPGKAPAAGIHDELSDLTAEELQTLKEKMGLKAFRKVFGAQSSEKSHSPSRFHRENKNRPSEVSSKRKVSVVRDMPGVSGVTRDPRFDDISGEFRQDIFERDFSFIDDIKSLEKKKVQKQLKKERREEKKEKLKRLLNKMDWKKKEKAMVKEGKAPYFLKKSDKTKLELAEKFKTLKQKGQVKQFIQKKRKRNSAKDRKKLPDARPS